MKLFTNKDKTTKITAIIVDLIFNFFLIFLLTIGFLCVSAGLFLNIKIVKIILWVNI